MLLIAFPPFNIQRFFSPSRVCNRRRDQYSTSHRFQIKKGLCVNIWKKVGYSTNIFLLFYHPPFRRHCCEQSCSHSSRLLRWMPFSDREKAIFQWHTHSCLRWQRWQTVFLCLPLYFSYTQSMDSLSLQLTGYFPTTLPPSPVENALFRTKENRKYRLEFDLRFAVSSTLLGIPLMPKAKNIQGIDEK